MCELLCRFYATLCEGQSAQTLQDNIITTNIAENWGTYSAYRLFDTALITIVIIHIYIIGC